MSRTAIFLTLALAVVLVAYIGGLIFAERL